MPWTAWRQNMELRLRGRITLRNIDYDIRFNRVSISLINELAQDVAVAWNKDDDPDKSPEDILIEVIDSPVKDYFCRGQSIPNPPHQCVRIMSGDDLVHYNVDRKKSLLSDRGYVSDRDMLVLSTFGLKGIIKSGSMMRTRRPFAWVTNFDEFYYYLSQVPEDHQPEFVRNVLGLLHFYNEEFLVAVKYPCNAGCGSPFSPTFMEGFPSMIYRSTQTPDGWGRAVNLIDYSDGLKEAIHPEVQFTDDFHLILIGRVPSLPPNSINHTQFLALL